MKHVINADGSESWYSEDGESYRTDGPSYINCDGSESWYNEFRELHRTDGPAFIDSRGDKEWWLDGKLHREDGPAVITGDGIEDYWLFGERQVITYEDSRWPLIVAKLKKLNVIYKLCLY